MSSLIKSAITANMSEADKEKFNEEMGKTEIEVETSEEITTKMKVNYDENMEVSQREVADDDEDVYVTALEKKEEFPIFNPNLTFLRIIRWTPYQIITAWNIND